MRRRGFCDFHALDSGFECRRQGAGRGLLVSALPSVLMVDDDPSHLRIYSWILEAAGCDPVTALVGVDGVDLPASRAFSLIILDYRLAGDLTAVDVAQKLQQSCPGTPILILSDLYGMPTDIAPYAACFVRKGEPEKLVATVRDLVFEHRR